MNKDTEQAQNRLPVNLEKRGSLMPLAKKPFGRLLADMFSEGAVRNSALRDLGFSLSDRQAIAAGNISEGVTTAQIAGLLLIMADKIHPSSTASTQEPSDTPRGRQFVLGEPMTVPDALTVWERTMRSEVTDPISVQRYTRGIRAVQFLTEIAARKFPQELLPSPAPLAVKEETELDPTTLGARLRRAEWQNTQERARCAALEEQVSAQDRLLNAALLRFQSDLAAAQQGAASPREDAAERSGPTEVEKLYDEIGALFEQSQIRFTEKRQGADSEILRGFVDRLVQDGVPADHPLRQMIQSRIQELQDGTKPLDAITNTDLRRASGGTISRKTIGLLRTGAREPTEYTLREFLRAAKALGVREQDLVPYREKLAAMAQKRLSKR